MAAAAQRAAPNHGSSSSRAPRSVSRPKLLLDSGACIHVVGDSRLLCKLRDAPAETWIMAVDGNTLPVTKIGDIHIQGFRIPDVHLVPGLKSPGLISVRVLTRSGIHTLFDGDRAMLFAGSDEVGVAVAPPEENGCYVLQSLSVPDSGLNDGEIRSLRPVCRWCRCSSAVASFGSVLCWLKALLRERLFGSEPEDEEKPMPEPHARNRTRRERRRKKKGKNSGTR